MKYICLVALALVASCAADGFKSDAGVNLAPVLDNLDQVKDIALCMIDKIECTPLSAGFKQEMPRALATGCKECTPEQKANSFKFFTTVKEHFGTEYKTMQQKYDPEDKLFSAFYKITAP